MQIEASYAGACADSSVHYRELPVIFVVDLRQAGHHDRACEHCPYLKILLVGYASEQFLEREHLVGSVGLGCGICRVIVLCECLFLELRIRAEG